MRHLILNSGLGVMSGGVLHLEQIGLLEAVPVEILDIALNIGALVGSILLLEEPPIILVVVNVILRS